MIRATLAILIALAVPAQAGECIPPDKCPEVCVGEYYIDNTFCQPGCIVSVGVYRESNGYVGLQREGDTCGGAIEEDTSILVVTA